MLPYTHEIGQSTASTIAGGSTAVGTPGTPVQLNVGSIRSRGVTVTARTGNVSPIQLGGSDVLNTGANAVTLTAGNSASFPIDNVNKLFLDGVTGGDIADWVYTR